MLPQEIRAEHWPERTTYDFPRRPVGALRYLGLFFVGFAVLFGWMPGKQVLQAIQHLVQGHAGTADLIFGAFTSIFVIAALLPLGLGLLMMFGRTRLVLTRDLVIVTEIAGPIRWRRKFKLADIERLEVASALGAKSSSSAKSPGLTGLGGLAAALRGKKSVLLLICYPQEWLTSMANELSSQMRLTGAPVPVTQVEMTKPSQAEEFEEITEQPPGSTAVPRENPLRHYAQGQTARVLEREPRLGVVWFRLVPLHRRGYSSAAAWKIRPGLFARPVADTRDPWLLGGRHAYASRRCSLGYRTCEIEADKVRLRISLRSAIRGRAWEWPVSGLRAITVGASNVEINNRRLQELQILPSTGKKVGVLAGRDPAELAWLATVLRNTIQLRSGDLVADRQLNS